MKKLACALLLLLTGLSAATLIVPLADITGDAAAHQVATVGIAQWIVFATPSTNVAAVRVGNSSTSSTVGFPIAAGGAIGYYPVTNGANGYDLSTLYYYAATGDKLYITYAK